MISHLVIKHLSCNSKCLLFVCVFAFLMCLLVHIGLEEQTTKYLYTCLNICVGIDFKIKSIYVIRGLISIFGLIFSLAAGYGLYVFGTVYPVPNSCTVSGF